MIGVGNRFRSDDAAGLEVVRRLRERSPARGVTVREAEGEMVALLDAWEGADAAVLVDAVSSGAPPGEIHRVDASAGGLPAALRSSSSTHAVGLHDAIELARVLGRLPRRVIVYGVEGALFEAGTELSAPVAAVVEALADAVLREAGELAGEPA